jgi:nicotinate-nucleotide adenylyltransferase
LILSARIGIYGGSFDPVHNGHVFAVHSFLNSGLIDEVWVLLTPYPPHKTDQSKTGYQHRFEMLKLAFEAVDNVHIKTVENELPSPSYTLQTLEHLEKTHPSHTFFLCLGEDSIQHFHTWHRYRDILKKCTIIVVERPGFNSSDVDKSILEKSIFIDHYPVDISSSQIRENKNGEESKVPQSVAGYIEKHQLYRS